MNEYMIRFKVKVWTRDRLVAIVDDQVLIAYGSTPVKAWMSVVASEAMRDRLAWRVLSIVEQRSDLAPSDVVGEVKYDSGMEVDDAVEPS